MRKLTFILLIFFALNIKAQDASIAKFKFEEAEVAYNSKKYEEALTKLDEVEKLLGKTYEKTLYLKIKALDNLIWEKTGSVDIKKITLLQKNYTDYLKTFEGQTEEEKYRDIYKISEIYNKHGIPPSIINGALAGSAEDCYILGRFCLKFEDFETAFKYFTFSAEKKYPKACVRMGVLYLSGHNVSEEIKLPKDAKKALELFETASLQNDWEANAILGYMYYFGFGVTVDKAKAEQYCKKTINNSSENYNKENDIGSNIMGIFYEFGVFVEKNYEQALYWYKNVPFYSYYYNATYKRLLPLQEFYNNLTEGDQYLQNKKYNDAVNSYKQSFEIKQDKDLRAKIALASLLNADELSNSNVVFDNIYGINAYIDAISYSVNKDITIETKLEEKLFHLYSDGKSNRVPKDGYYYNQPFGVAYMSLFPEGKYIQIVKSEVENQLNNYLKSVDKDYDKSIRYFLLRYIYLFPNGKYVEKAKTKLQAINSQGQVTTTPFGLTLEKYNGDESLLQNKFIIKSVESKKGFMSQLKLVKNNQATYITHVDGIPIDDLTLQVLNNLLTSSNSGLILLTYKEVYNGNLILTRNIVLYRNVLFGI